MARPLLARATRIIAKARGRDASYLIWKSVAIARRRARRRGLPPGLTAYAAERALRRAAKGRRDDWRSGVARIEGFLHADGNTEAVVDRLGGPDRYVQSLVERAEAVVARRLRVLAAGEQQLGSTIDWHAELLSGGRWPVVRSQGIDFFQLDHHTDARTTWELNRLHFLVDLAKAYSATGDELYAQQVTSLVAQWDDANPVDVGINWTCAMEAAIRAVNIMYAITLVSQSPAADEPFVGRLSRMLYQHGSFVRRNMEYSDVRGNHYLSDLVGLIWIGLFLPGVPRARRWLAFAAPRFEAELLHQVNADGSTNEGSIPYHRLVTELFLYTSLLLERHGHKLSNGFWSRLEEMARCIAAYTKPDGTCPLLGDNDNGRLLILGDAKPNDHRYLLAIAAARFQRSDLKSSAGRLWEDAAWILGRTGVDVFDRLPSVPAPQSSARFDGAGWYFLRSCGNYVAVGCAGDEGFHGRGGHGHCDVLSVELALQGETLVVDRGCGLYTACRRERIEVVGARSHNVVLVDGQEYGVVKSHDIPAAGNTPARVTKWVHCRDKTVFEGEHYGYRLQGITSRRGLSVSSKEIEICDEVVGHGSYRLTSRFHLSPGYAATMLGQGCRIQSPSRREFCVTSSSAAHGYWRAEPSTIYSSYGRAEPTQCIMWETTAVLPVSVTHRWVASDGER